MATLRTWTVGLDDVLALFSGADAVATTLRRLALDAYPAPPKPPHVGTLDRLGPFSRHPVGGAPVVRPGVPTRRELDAVLAGRPVPEGRRSAAWALVELWLDHVATASDMAPLDDVRVWSESRLELPVTPPRGTVVGYRDGVLGVIR